MYQGVLCPCGSYRYMDPLFSRADGICNTRCLLIDRLDCSIVYSIELNEDKLRVALQAMETEMNDNYVVCSSCGNMLRKDQAHEVLVMDGNGLVIHFHRDCHRLFVALQEKFKRYIGREYALPDYPLR